MACKTCYNDYINCGVDEIIISTDVVAATAYKVVIETPAGAKYMSTITSDVFGDLTLDVADYPAGLFNPHAGMFSLHLDTGCDDFLFCDSYKYINFEVLYGNQAKNTLSCCEPSSENQPAMATCCTTETITFLDEAVTVVPYTGTRPMIEVAYLNPDGSFTLGSMGISTLVTFGPTSFTIDHGGVSSGVVKLLK